jgi:uncharacterized protein YaaN involved in tellurite resistance
MANAGTKLPDNLRWWIHVGLAVIIAGLLFTVGIATAQHLADDQFIGDDELKQSLQQLESYTSETKFLSQEYYRQSAPRPYVEAYGSDLQKAVDNTSQKLNEHPHADSLDDKVKQAIDSANQLSDQLNELITEPLSQLPPQPQANQTLEQLSDSFQNLEQSL